MDSMSTPIHAVPTAEEPRSEAVARRFRGVLAEMGLSVNQASKKLGMEQTALNRRARHETEFRIDELDHIEEVLGIPAAYLLGFTEERPVVPPRREAEIRFIQPNPRPTD